MRETSRCGADEFAHVPMSVGSPARMRTDMRIDMRTDMRIGADADWMAVGYLGSIFRLSIYLGSHTCVDMCMRMVVSSRHVAKRYGIGMWDRHVG